MKDKEKVESVDGGQRCVKCMHSNVGEDGYCLQGSLGVLRCGCKCTFPVAAKVCRVANPGGIPCSKPKGHPATHDETAYGPVATTEAGEAPELTPLQLAFNDGIESAKAAIRSVESEDTPFFINAVARLCNPYAYRSSEASHNPELGVAGSVQHQTESECSNKYCLDGWVNHEVGTQDGRESYVEQVPCQVCCVHCDPESVSSSDIQAVVAEESSSETVESLRARVEELEKELESRNVEMADLTHKENEYGGRVRGK